MSQPSEVTNPLSWLPGFIALGLVWGSSFLFIELALESFSPIGIAFLRSFLGGASLLIIVWISKQKLPRNWKHWADLFVVAALLNAVPFALFPLGQESVSSAIAGVVNSTTPLMTVLVVIVLFRDQWPTVNQIVGVIIGFSGILLLMEIFSSGSGGSVVGVSILLLATLCYGLGMSYAKRFVSSLPYSPYVLAASQVSAATVLTAPAALLWGFTSAAPTQLSILGIGLLGILGTGIAYVWNYRNIELAGSVVASSVTYITPVVAVVIGALFLREQLSATQLVGGVLILLSALLVQGRIKLLPTREL